MKIDNKRASGKDLDYKNLSMPYKTKKSIISNSEQKKDTNSENKLDFTHIIKKTIKLDEVGNNWIGEAENDNTISNTNLLDQIEGQLSTKQTHFLELEKKYPYIERLRRASENYRVILRRLETLARYNATIKSVLKSKIIKDNNKALNYYNDLLKRNRTLRIEIKCLLVEEKKSENIVNAFGKNKKVSIKNEEESNVNSKTKRELIKIRDTLLKENDTLLFQLKKDLI